MLKLLKSVLFLVLLMVTFSITSVVFKSLMRDTLVEFNYSSSKEQSKTALSAFSRRVEPLEKLTKDWGQWDDAYQFVIDQNEEFETSNLIEETLSASNLNMILFFDNEGYIIFKKAVSIDGKGDTTIPSEVFNFTTNNSKIRVAELIKSGSSQSGILHTTRGPFLFSVSPITRSDGTGPANGAIMMARYVNSADINELRKVTGLDLDLIDHTSVERHFKGVKLSELERGPVLISKEDGLSVFLLATDSWGDPAQVIKVEFDLVGFDYGTSLINLLTIISTLISGLFALSILLIFGVKHHVRESLIEVLEEGDSFSKRLHKHKTRSHNP